MEGIKSAWLRNNCYAHHCLSYSHRSSILCFMRIIKNIVVLGSGVMGSGIACHFANAGFKVKMLDLPPQDPGKPRNSIAEEALKKVLKQKPAPLYKSTFVSRITAGNFDDDLQPALKDADWIIEVIAERLDFKQALYARVDAARKSGSIVTSNTSGIPIHLMAEGRSDDFRKHFLGTHFFNPVRYLPLLEVIPTEETDQELVDFIMQFGRDFLGKKTVHCKDTPAFIANRVGVLSMARIFELSETLDLPIEVVDKLTGPALARPNTGTFRLADLVGLDTSISVMQGIQQNCPNDQQAQQLAIPKFLQYLVDNGFYGNKTGQGFYKKGEKNADGKTDFLSLNLKTLTYEKPNRTSLPSLALSKQIDNPKRRIKSIYEAADAGGQLVKQHLLELFAYVSNRIPEIADDITSIDDALKAGFAWSYGPFEYWDIIGLEQATSDAKKAGLTINPWIDQMIGDGFTSFYNIENGKSFVYSPFAKNYIPVKGQDATINLQLLRQQVPVYKNDDAVLHDIGDGVLCYEFRSKSNVLGENILKGLNESITLAEEQGWKGLVIGNQATNFTVGANLMIIGMMAFQEEWDQLNNAVDYFQQTTMRCRYSSIPVVMATQGYVFGGGCEFLMHCDAAAVAAESYIGLVEAGVGLIPGGGGSKEMAVRLSDSFVEGGVQIPQLIDSVKTVATATVATSAYEAFDMNFLLQRRDQIVINTSQNILRAKYKALELSRTYVSPIKRKDILALGQQGLASLYAFANEFRLGAFGSDHDIKIVKKLAWVMCGGDLTGAQRVSEQYLLDLEREAFLSLCGEQKTKERIQYMLEKNKPLRN